MGQRRGNDQPQGFILGELALWLILHHMPATQACARLVALQRREKIGHSCYRKQDLIGEFTGYEAEGAVPRF